MKDAIKIAIEALQANQKSWKTLADSGDAGNWKAEEQPVWRQTEDALSIMRRLAEDAEPVNRCITELLAFAKDHPGTYIFPSWDGSRVMKYLATSPQSAQTEAQEREEFEAEFDQLCKDYSIYGTMEARLCKVFFEAGRAGRKV